jgi:hypothetical protein
MRWYRPIIGLLQFVVILGVLYAIWAWNDGRMGYWGFPVAFGIASVPSVAAWLFRRGRDPIQNAPSTKGRMQMPRMPRWFLWLLFFWIALMFVLYVLFRPIP